MLDGDCGDAELSSLRFLLERLPADRYAQSVALIDPRARTRVEAALGRPVRPASRRWSAPFVSGPPLRDLCRAESIQLLHAWGVDALGACRAAAGGRALVTSVLRASAIEPVSRWLRPCEPSPAVVVDSQTARAGLLTRGLPSQRVVVVRPAVDFGAINAARRSDLRARLVGDAGPVMLTPGPAIRGDGQFEAAWTTAILRLVFPRVRLILPGESRDQARVRHLFAAAGMDDVLVATGDELRWSQLVAAADMLLLCPSAEAGTEPIAWAMAAGLTIVGVARRSIAELIADRSNGLLCKSNKPLRVAAVALRALEDEPLRRRLGEVARGQAYEVFSQRAFIDNHRALYENVLAGRPVASDVRDTAMVA